MDLKEFEVIKNKYKLTNIQLAHFVSQCHHETMGFKRFIESLNYSSERLLVVFPKYFTKELAEEVEGNQERIGNIIYGNRLGNGANEGALYRGRGALHLTGKTNYREFSKFIGVDCVSHPELVADKFKFDSAIWLFFNKNKIWDICNREKPETITKVTKIINGGYNGLRERQQLFIKYNEMFKNL